MNIYVGNLPFNTTEEDLRAAFEPFGKVDSAVVIKDHETGRSRGFGFVEMSDNAEGQTAIDAMNNRDMGGRPLKVNEARPRGERPAGGGGGFRERRFDGPREGGGGYRSEGGGGGYRSEGGGGGYRSEGGSGGGYRSGGGGGPRRDGGGGFNKGGGGGFNKGGGGGFNKGGGGGFNKGGGGGGYRSDRFDDDSY